MCKGIQASRVVQPLCSRPHGCANLLHKIRHLIDVPNDTPLHESCADAELRNNLVTPAATQE